MNVHARSLSILGLVLVAAAAAQAQGPHPLSAEEKAKVEGFVRGMSLQQKIDYIGGTGFAVRGVPALGLPVLEMSDGPYGTRSNAGFPSTTYAAGIGLAASWDRELASRVGEGIGRDARARGVMFMLGPGVNIYRSPRNGRNFEYFGEDPFLTSSIAVGYITGMQTTGVSSTIKHYLGNNSEYLRHDSDSIIDERAAREIYLPAFEAAVKKANVGAIMDSYNLINGQHATQNGYFNTDIARKEWGFQGTLMSDWDATYDAVGAANGGLDLEMPTGKFMNQKTLLPAVQSGAVKESVIDEKVRRILSTAMSFGWLDASHNQTDANISYFDARNRQAALDSARESTVLLKNDGNLLPLNASKLKTVLIVGPDAYPGVAVGGGSAGVVPFHLVSDVEGLGTLLGSSVNLLYDRGLPSLSELARGTDFSQTPGGAPGLEVEAFSNSELSGTPISKIVIRHISLSGTSWQSFGDDVDAMMALFSQPGKKSSRRMTGYYTAAADAEYIVALEGAGEGSGNRVYLDDKLIIDDWTLVRAFQPTLTMHLAAGPHKVVVEESQSGPIGGHLRLAIVDQTRIVHQRAIDLAAKADVVIVSAGFSSESEGEGGDRTFSLPYGQDALIRAMASANPKTIVSITSGGNVDSIGWIDRVPAVLERWYAGQEGGTAFAEILTGKVNPSGHLPATFERKAEDNPTNANYYPEEGTKRVLYKESIFVGYRGYERSNTKPLFPFGYGLSYTSFHFSGLKIVSEFNSADPHVTVFFDVKNTGSRAGAEVAQVYVGEDHASVPRPLHELKGFERVQLAPGETKHLSVSLDPRAFSFYDVTAKAWKIDSGRFTISVGDNVADLPLIGSVDSPKQ